MSTKDEKDKTKKLKKEGSKKNLDKKKDKEKPREVLSFDDGEGEPRIGETDDLGSLSIVQPGFGENELSYRQLYNLFPEKFYTSYFKLLNYSREFSSQFPLPEFVIVGPQGNGKSSLLEALIGFPLNWVSFGAATRRPIFLKLINSPECATPKVILERDSVLVEFGEEKVVSVDQLGSELEKRNRVFSDEGIFVRFEWREVMNFTIIDAPGFVSRDKGDVTKAKLESIVLDLMRPPHRHIICCEDTKDWASVNMVELIKKDPEFKPRTTFVYTKFYSFTTTFASRKEVNRYLANMCPPGHQHIFFITLLSPNIRPKPSDTDQYRKIVWQLQRRDISLLEGFQYDLNKFSKHIGLHNLRKHILQLAIRTFEEGVPKIVHDLRNKRSKLENELLVNTQQIERLNSLRFREIASKYTIDFLRTVDQLITGSSVGNPAIHGQTLEQEKDKVFASGYKHSNWVNFYGIPIEFNPATSGIAFHDSKLYGGQQFERLLHEFKAVAEQQEFQELTVDDIITAAGSRAENYEWAASDLARKRSQEALVPLINQACDRAIFIMSRLADISENILEYARRKDTNRLRAHTRNLNNVFDIEQYIYFTHYVKDLYQKFVNQTAEICRKKCMDEFHHTNAVYWEFTKHEGIHIDLTSKQRDPQKAVKELSVKMFKELQTRIIKNVILKLYGFFLYPLQSDLWQTVQNDVNSLNDLELEKKFEVHDIVQKMKEFSTYLRKEITKCTELEVDLLQSSDQFSHPDRGGVPMALAPPPAPSSSKSSKVDTSPVFGKPLDEVIQGQQKAFPDLMIPLIVHRSIEHIEQKALKIYGVFRTSASLDMINQLRRSIETNPDYDFSNVEDPNVVVGLLRQYLNELPSPVMTFELYPRFLAAIQLEDRAKQIEGVRNVIKELPKYNKALTQALISLLSKVKENSAVNQMTSDNLARVMGPPMLYDKTPILNMNEVNCVNNVVKLMIDEYKQLFEEK